MSRKASPNAPPPAHRLRGGLLAALLLAALLLAALLLAALLLAALLLPALLLAALLCLAPVRARAQNYLHTSGTKIVDSKGNVVRLTGLNWFGLETSTYCPHGLWARSMGPCWTRSRAWATTSCVCRTATSFSMRAARRTALTTH